MNALTLATMAGHAVGTGPRRPISETITRVKPEPEPDPDPYNLPERAEDAATISVGSDRYPATIVARPNEKTVVVRRDRYRRTDKNGQSESQTYEYAPGGEGDEQTFTLRKNGRWIAKGSAMHNGTPLGIGVRNAYQDPSY